MTNITAAASKPDAAVTKTTTMIAEKPPATPQTTKVSTEPAPVVPSLPKHPLDDYVMGYPKIATRMGLIPETAMFRRFGALNARNLLYLQNDLAQMEEELLELELEREDNESATGEKGKYALNAYWLGTASVSRDGDTKQRDLVLKMRDVLHQYSMCSCIPEYSVS
jgi:hypothetical protein